MLTDRGRCKMAVICRRYFRAHFLEWQLLNFNYNFTEICSFGSNWQYKSIGSDNCLTPNRHQAIISTNDVLSYWRLYASLCLNELNIFWPKPTSIFGRGVKYIRYTKHPKKPVFNEIIWTLQWSLDIIITLTVYRLLKVDTSLSVIVQGNLPMCFATCYTNQ